MTPPKPREFNLIGVSSGSASKWLTTDVTDLYDSKVPLIAGSKLMYREECEDLVKENRYTFRHPDDWTVSQYRHFDEDKAGVYGFRMVRMDIFDELWRKPVSVVDYGLHINDFGIFFISGPNNKLVYSTRRGFSLDLDSPFDTVTWLYKHDPMVYLFTDGDRMFVDPQDELAYITDVLNNAGTDK